MALRWCLALAVAVVAAAGCGDDKGWQNRGKWAARGDGTVIIPQPGDPPLGEPIADACDDLPATDGQQIHVAPTGSDAGDGSESGPLGSIQAAFDLAQPGDTVVLAPGRYEEEVRTVRDGTAEAPIVVVGPADAVVQGIEVLHDHHLLCDFTVEAIGSTR